MIRLLIGDCREVLRTLPDESVHCVVTSPPYWGLRDYGIEPQIYGGDVNCPHEWGEPQRPGNYNWGDKIIADGKLDAGHQKIAATNRSAYCRHCNAWRGCLGLEPTLGQHVEIMVSVFREVRRVLCKDGTLWLNYGDSYAANGRSAQLEAGGYLKPKDLCGIPWRVAFALQADGWWLRQDIIWSKPNPMPESVTDRCTKAHEYIFLLSKSERYYYDADAIAEPQSTGQIAKYYGTTGESSPWNAASGNYRDKSGSYGNGETRNKRSVWEVVTTPFSEAHFATFPPALIEPCILAGCPKGESVLDPFGGAGTTGLVADRLGRNAILIELNPEYAAMAERRIKNDAGMFASLERVTA